jgi:hypothetical protein
MEAPQTKYVIRTYFTPKHVANCLYDKDQYKEWTYKTEEEAIKSLEYNRQKILSGDWDHVSHSIITKISYTLTKHVQEIADTRKENS